MTRTWSKGDACHARGIAGTVDSIEGDCVAVTHGDGRMLFVSVEELQREGVDEMETTTETTTENGAGWQGAIAASSEAEERAAQNAMPPRRFEEMLPCKLSDEEVLAKGDELEAALDDVDLLRSEKKDRTAEINARIKIAEARVVEIREVRRTRIETRPVESIESFHFRLGVARKTRTDTGEVYEERALRASELQPSLPAVESSPQMNLADAELDETGEYDEADEDDGAAIDDPQAVLDAEPKAETPKRSRRAKG